jgi:hypothetical protein
MQIELTPWMNYVKTRNAQEVLKIALMQADSRFRGNDSIKKDIKAARRMGKWACLNTVEPRRS